MAAVNVKRLKIIVRYVSVVCLTFLEMKMQSCRDIHDELIHFRLLIYTS